MISLQIDELSRKIIGYCPNKSNVANMHTVSGDINDYLIESKSAPGIRVLPDNLYLINGEIVKLENQSTLYGEIQEKQQELQTIQSEISNAGDLFAQKLMDGLTVQEAADYIKDKKQTELHLQQKIALLSKEYEKQLSALYKKLDKEILSSLNHAYYSSVCLLIKDENEYLEEWLHFYAELGADHIWIYDNGYRELVPDIVNGLGKEIQDKITVVPYHDSETQTLQQDAYMHFLNTYGPQTRWVGFLDSDEFVKLKDGSADINRFLKQYEEYGAFYMGWVTYNANGQMEKTSEPVQKRFTQEVPEPENHIFNKAGKVFMQPHKVEKLYRYHPVFRNNNQLFLNEQMNKDIAVINHYYTKSLEEWQNKIERGSCDSVYRRSYHEFFKLNPDMAHLNDGKTMIQNYNTQE